MKPRTTAVGASVLHEETVVALAASEHLGVLHDALARFWTAMPTAPPNEWRYPFEAAVMEIANNIIEHAYPQGRPDAKLKFRLRAYHDRVEAIFTDRGVPYEENSAPPAQEADPLIADLADFEVLAEGGRGIALARTAVDMLEYSRRARGANRWRLVKRLRGQ